MQIKKSTKANKLVFDEWTKSDNMEELTCRPVENNQREKIEIKPTFLSYFIEGVKDPVGKFVCFDINPRNKSCEFGYMISLEYRGKGIGKQMIRDCVQYVFKNTDYNKLYCQTASFNKPSVNLLENLEFKKDGVLREHHELNGELFDDYIYSVLRREFC